MLVTRCAGFFSHAFGDALLHLIPSSPCGSDRKTRLRHLALSGPSSQGKTATATESLLDTPALGSISQRQALGFAWQDTALWGPGGPAHSSLSVFPSNHIPRSSLYWKSAEHLDSVKKKVWRQYALLKRE